MKYNPKGMIRGALTAAAGLAMAVSTGCGTSREADIDNSPFYAMAKARGDIDDAKLAEVLRSTTYVDGTLLNQPSMVQGQPGYMRIELQDSKGRRKVIQVEYPNRTDNSSDRIAESLAKDLREKSRKANIGTMDLSLGFSGKVNPTGVITNLLKSYSIATSPRDFGRQ